MSNEMTVGCIRTTVIPPLASGIYGALLEKAERDNAELADRLSGLELSTTQQLAELENELNNMQDQRDLAIRMAKEHAKQIEVTKQALGSALEREKQWKEESLEQARLLGKGGEREARLITERDHYKQAIEHISATIDDWLNSLVQEPPDDFIHAIKAWADKKLKEI